MSTSAKQAGSIDIKLSNFQIKANAYLIKLDTLQKDLNVFVP